MMVTVSGPRMVPDDSDDFGGRPSLFSGPAEAAVVGTDGDDVLLGGALDEELTAAAGRDTVSSGGGSDLIYGNQGADEVTAGDGRDVIYGGQNDGPPGDDGMLRDGLEVLYGNAGADLIYGNMGSDVLYGGAGDDTLYGGQDADSLHGGLGDDLLSGDLGADSYHFNAADEGRDTIAAWSAEDTLVFHETSIASMVDAGDRTEIVLSSGTRIDVVGAEPIEIRWIYFT